MGTVQLSDLPFGPTKPYEPEISAIDQILGYQPFSPVMETIDDLSIKPHQLPYTIQVSEGIDRGATVNAMRLAADTHTNYVDLLQGAFTPWTPDETFNPATIMKERGDEEHSLSLLHAVNQENYDFLLNASMRDHSRARNWQQSSWSAALISLPFDVTNIIPGVLAFKSVGTAAKVTNAALTGAAFASAEEITRSMSDINFSVERAQMNIAASTAFSALLGGTIDVSIRGYNNFVVDSHRNFRARSREIDLQAQLQRRQGDFVVRQRTSRPLGYLEDWDLEVALTQIESSIHGLTVGVERLKEKQDAGTITTPEIRELNNKSGKLTDRHLEHTKHMQELTDRRIDLATTDGVLDARKLAAGYKWNPIRSPYKSIMMLDPIKDAAGNLKWSGLNMLKDAVAKIGGDHGTLTHGNQMGIPSNRSIDISIASERRHWARVNKATEEAYAEHTDTRKINLFGLNPSSMWRSITGSGETLKSFRTEANRKRIFQEEASSPAELKVMQAQQNYYQSWGDRIEANHHMGNQNRLAQGVAVYERDLLEIEAQLRKRLSAEVEAHYKRRQVEVTEELNKTRSALAVVQSGRIKGQVDEPFFNRIWDSDAIRNNLDAFKAIIRSHFIRNPSVARYNPQTKLHERKTLSIFQGRDLDDAVDDVVESILNDKDPFETDIMQSLSDSNRLAHRMIDIPNKDVFNFIMHDPLAAMQNYSERVAGKYHWSQSFEGRTPKGVWQNIEDQLIKDGYSKRWIDKARLNFNVLEGRVMSTPLASPERWDQLAAQRLKEFTSLNYLSTSGIASIPDFGRTLMEHETRDVFLGMFRMFTDREFRDVMRAVRTEIGEGLDIIMGAAHHRLDAGLTRNVDTAGLWNQTRQAGHIMNGLGPITEFFKTFEGAMRMHTLITYARRHNDGTASKYESDYMARYGFTIDDMKEIANTAPYKLMKGGKNRKNGFYLANIHDWEAAGVSKNVIRKYREAVSSGVLNTIVSATPADRPIMSDGTVFIPIHVAQKLPWGKKLKEDERNKGYVRIESGAMTLPFQFYSFMFASMNKVTAAYATGHVKNRVTGAVAAMGLGYISIMLKTPDYIWDQMSERDRFARAFDYSGLASLHSSLVYDSMQTQLAAGGDPFFGKFVSPKFDQEANMADFATSIAGAGSSTLLDGYRGFAELFDGDALKGAAMLGNTLPLTGTLPVKIFTDEIADVLGGGYRGGRN